MDVVARDCDGTPIKEKDVVVVLGTLGTVKHVVKTIEQRPAYKGRLETVLLTDGGARILPGCVRKEVTV